MELFLKFLGVVLRMVSSQGKCFLNFILLILMLEKYSFKLDLRVALRIIQKELTSETKITPFWKDAVQHVFRP